MQTRMLTVGLGLLLAGMSCIAQQAEVVANSATNQDSQVSIKAMEAEMARLELQLTTIKMKLKENGGGRDPGYLEDLERKALAFEAMQPAMAMKDKEIERLKKAIADAEKASADVQGQVALLVAETNKMAAAMIAMEKELKPIKEAMELIRKGKFEYYEIREGDTCESIAKKETIYNDETKAVLIRQANRGGVADLDHLVPGEVLVIPRFSLGGNYEF